MSRKGRRHSSRSAAGSEQSVLVGVDDGLHPVAQVELRERAGEMALHRRLAEIELAGDLRVGHPARDKKEDVPLALAEPADGLRRLDVRRGPLAELLEQ